MSLVLDLLQSLHDCKSLQPFDVGVLDVGLSQEGREQIEASGAIIGRPRVDIDYRGREAWETEMPFIRAMTARPFLPHYFPDYQTHMWLDADTWLQNSEMLDVVLPAASNDKSIYIAAEFDRDYRQLLKAPRYGRCIPIGTIPFLRRLSLPKWHFALC